MLTFFRIGFRDAHERLFTFLYFVFVAGNTNAKAIKKRPIDIPATNLASDKCDRITIVESKIIMPNARSADCESENNGLEGLRQRVCSSFTMPPGHSKQKGVGPVRTKFPSQGIHIVLDEFGSYPSGHEMHSL
jgi:hypothetical protein